MGNGHCHHGHTHGAVITGGADIGRLSAALREPDLASAITAAALLLAGLLLEYAFSIRGPLLDGIYIAAAITAGWRSTLTSFRQALTLTLDVDTLMVVAALGAAALGKYFDGALLLFLFALGHGLEGYATGRARHAIEALGQLTPHTARVVRDGAAVEVPIERLHIGDLVQVRPGERIAVDGTVVEGQSGVDQSPITGESVPVFKAAGAPVFAGTLSTDGTLTVRTAKLASESTMARMIRLVEESQKHKGKTQRVTERFTRTYTPIILVGVPLLVGALMSIGGMTFSDAFLRSMAVLVGASPCALAISTPSAVLAGIARAAQRGVLIKGGEYLEALGSIRAIAFDKTGTLTAGRPELLEAVPAPGSNAAELLRTAHALDQHSLHPLATAIVRGAAERGHAAPAASEIRSIPGRGLLGMVAGQRAAIGSSALFDGHTAPQSDAAANAEVQRQRGLARTATLVSIGDRVCGVLALADQPREQASAQLDQLRAMGVQRLVMLTGDNPEVAREIARVIGVDEVMAELVPEAKVTAVASLLSQYGSVAFVGDGVNDAPALAAATVGVAMGASGADVALEAADVALMADDLSKLSFAVGLSRAARKIIRQNVAISLGMVALLIPLGALGVTDLTLAVIGHEGSTVLVVFNALRLLGYSAAARAAEGD